MRNRLRRVRIKAPPYERIFVQGETVEPIVAATILSVVFAVAAAASFAQGWAPQKNVEIVAASPPGGSNDNTARTIERSLASTKGVPTTVTIVNKPGGGGTIAATYVAQRAGDPNYLLV